MNNPEVFKHLSGMAHSSIGNYVVPDHDVVVQRLNRRISALEKRIKRHLQNLAQEATVKA